VRKIKFRALALHKDGTKEWFFYNTRNGNILSEMYLNHKIKRWIVDDLQYTGLKDRTDKEIYEEDIVKAEDGIWEVEVINLEDGVVLVNSEKEEASIEFAEGSYCLRETEVIGDIYSNPDLLKTRGEK